MTVIEYNYVSVCSLLSFLSHVLAYLFTYLCVYLLAQCIIVSNERKGIRFAVRSTLQNRDAL